MDWTTVAIVFVCGIFLMAFFMVMNRYDSKKSTQKLSYDELKLRYDMDRYWLLFLFLWFKASDLFERQTSYLSLIVVIGGFAVAMFLLYRFYRWLYKVNDNVRWFRRKQVDTILNQDIPLQ